MILVDTTVWVDHLRNPELELREQLNANNVLTHPIVIGELACGGIPDRARFLRMMDSIPQVREGTHREVRDFIETQRLISRGIGFMDAHLLYSVTAQPDALLWTRDMSLNRIARQLSVSYDENP